MFRRLPRLFTRFAATLLLGSSLPASAAQGAEYVNTYLDLWLKAHQFKAYTKSSAGIVFDADGSQLDGDIQQVKELKPNQLYSMETRLTLKMKDGRILEEMVAGMGADPRASLMDALENFCATTLHPLFAAQFEPIDPHVRKARWSLGGQERQIFLSPWGQRFSPISETAQQAIEASLKAALQDRALSNDLHWLKLVVAGEQGHASQILLTIDGQVDESLTAMLMRQRFNLPKDLFMGKLFFAVAKRP